MSGSGHRIVLVSRGLDPIGTGRQVLLAARGLVERGWEVHLATVSREAGVAGSSESPLDSIARSIGAAVHPLCGRPAWSTGSIDPSSMLSLAGLLRCCKPDVVEAWGWKAAAAAAAAVGLAGIGRGGRKPALAIRAATPPGCSWPRWAAVSRADLVLADGEGVAQACREGSPGAAVAVVRPGITLEPDARNTRAEVAARYGLCVDRPWTLCVAPLEAAARIERLVWAMDQLDVVHAGVEHVIIGAGGQAHRLGRRARLQQVAPRLRVVPCLPRPLREVGCDLIPHAAVVWQSGEVALGGAILDAMAAGRPVVAVESLAARNLVEDGVSGRIVPADPVSEFPRQALRLLEDASLARRFGEAALLRAASLFSLDAFQEAHAAAIEPLTRH